MSANMWLISDPHFSHEGSLHWDNKETGNKVREGFTDVNHMNEVIIERWNSVVRPQDHCYCLGDVAMKRQFLPIVRRLQGHKRLIFGNHDIFDYQEYAKAGFEKMMGMRVLDGIIFTHVPIHPNQLGRFKLNVHGHMHQHRVKLDNGHLDERYHSVCVEQVGYTPVALEDLKKLIK